MAGIVGCVFYYCWSFAHDKIVQGQQKMKSLILPNRILQSQSGEAKLFRTRFHAKTIRHLLTKYLFANTIMSLSEII